MGADEQGDFVGRGAELEALTAALSRHKLTLLLGPGGAGKTRLARVIQRRLAELSPLFCDLSSASTADDVLGALGALLGVSLEAGEALVDQLRLALQGSGCKLVILDNLESIGAGAEAVRALLAIDIHFLGTSRVVGPFNDAYVIEVGPLSAHEAEQLFTDRARRAAPHFELDAAARELLDKLGGNALAIELAAARVRVLPPSALLERFRQHLDLLRGGEERPARHRSLRAVVAGSWSLCGEDERAALAAASVFRAGFDLAAAEAVLGEHAESSLDQLLASSLLLSTHVSGLGPRFSLSESVREFAGERLAEDPDRAGEVARRFAAHYRAVAVDHSPRAENADRASLAVLAREAENLLHSFRLDGRSALAYDLLFQRTTPVDAHVATLVATRGRLSSAGLADRAELEVAIAHALRRAGKSTETLSQAERATQLAEQAERPDLIASSLLIEAAALYDAVQLHEAKARAERAVTTAEKCGSWSIAARGASLLAFSAMESGDLRAADRYGEQAMQLARTHGLTLAELNAENLFGSVEARRGRLDNAEDHLRRGLSIIDGLGLTQQEALTWGNLGKVLMMAGRGQPAREALVEALERSRRSGLHRVEIVHHLNLAKLEADQGQLAEARARALLADSLVKGIDSRLAPSVAALLGVVAMLEGRFEAAVGELERATARARQAHPGPVRASLLATQAAALALAGDLAAGERLLEQARDVSTELQAIEIGLIAAFAACVSFARAAHAGATGDAQRARAATLEGEGTLALSLPRATTSVDVRLARRIAEAARAAAGASREALPQPSPASARSSFELISRAGSRAGSELPHDADLGFDAVERRAVIDGSTVIDLRKKPLAARLLEVVLSHPNKSLDKSALYRAVWQAEFRQSSQAAALYKAVDRLAHLLDGDPRRFLRWDETGALVLAAKQPALLRAPSELET